MEGFSFFVAGGDFIRIIGYNVVYFFIIIMFIMFI